MDLSHSQLDRIFEYAVPEELQKQMQVGYRVLVSFGRQTTEGFVLALSDTAIYDPEKIKPIIRLLDEYPVFLQDQIELGRWIAEKYNCNLVDALRLMIPAQIRGGRIHEKTVSVVQLLIKGEALEAAKKSLFGSSGKCKAPLQLEILNLLDSAKSLGMKELEERIKGARNAVRSMEKKGWLCIQAQETYRRPYSEMIEQNEIHELTEEQSKLVERLKKALEEGRGDFVLRGVTGSGKTEVYLQAIKHCVSMGKSAIMLVPEISLTPQTVERFRSRFGNAVAVLHSRLSAGERYDEWRRIRLGEVKVVVGARSAVFAPCEKLGLIVIDEEHESSYQSDKTPRYHAIDVAQKRCLQQGGALLLGSATPSIETWQRAKKGEFEILSLPKRINGMPLPSVEVIDMREELAQGNKSMFSMALYRQMKECFLQGKQMILFLNRRGYSTFVSCRGCGYVLECDDCDVSMTYHKIDATVRCHYCDAVKPIPETCPNCGKPYLKHFGVGTQQVEEQVLRLFPGIRVIRMDYDTTQKKDAHLKLLQAFREGEAEVLIGTQMIAKGLDFPNVTLVGVIAADAALFAPDYRSAERAFQLITQVAGRAGRDKDAGRVVVQSYSPQHPSIAYSAHHDFEAFFQYEIQGRKESEFPPFADFVRFLFSSENDGQAAAQCKDFKEKLGADIEAFMAREKIDRDMLLYLSAHAAPMHRLKGIYRHQVVLKLLRNEHTEKIIDRMAAFAKEMRTEGFLPVMERNPQNMT